MGTAGPIIGKIRKEKGMGKKVVNLGNCIVFYEISRGKSESWEGTTKF